MTPSRTAWPPTCIGLLLSNRLFPISPHILRQKDTKKDSWGIGSLCLYIKYRIFGGKARVGRPLCSGPAGPGAAMILGRVGLWFPACFSPFNGHFCFFYNQLL